MDVAVAVVVGVGVAVGVQLPSPLVGEGLGVRVADGDGLGANVSVGVGVWLPSVCVGEGLGVRVAVGVAVRLASQVGEGLGVSVAVTVAVGGAVSSHCAWPVVFGFVAGYWTVRSVAGDKTRRWGVGFVPLLPQASGKQNDRASSETNSPGVVGLGQRVSTTLPKAPLLEARA